MLNGIFVFLALVSILLAAVTGRMQQLTNGILTDARTAVEIAIKLVGVMAFFLGLMKVAEDSGLLSRLARLVAPVMRRLFPDVPAEHPAMSAMVMNISSNFLGLGNAATPFGIKAMEELNELNREKGTATNAMVVFLAINTAGLAILPSTIIALRAAAGSADATGIFVPTWLASGTATVVGISAALLLSRLPRYRRSAPPPAPDSRDGAGTGAPGPLPPPAIGWRRVALWVFWALYVALGIRHVIGGAAQASTFEITRDVMSFWILPALVAGTVLSGWSRGVAVYESLVEGAKEGFRVAVRIIPFLVAILVAVGMFRTSGGMELLVDAIGPLTMRLGLPAEALPMAILRPLTGSGATGVMVEMMRTHGADSFIGYMVSTLMGSTETTFYVLAVYFGAVGVKRTRHAVPACLAADAAGMLAAVTAVNFFFGS